MKKLLFKLAKIEEAICCLALAITVLAILANTLCGWFLGKRLGQLEEIALASFVWVTFFSIGLVYKLGSQISIDFLVDLLPKQLKKIMKVIVSVIVSLSSLYIIFEVYTLMINAIEKKTPLLKISYFYIDFSAFLGFILLCIYSFLQLLDDIKNMNLSKRKIWH